jgi:succinyl-CoA synthetase beta subunit
MNIHEYQAKELFRKYNIPVPKGHPAFSADEATAKAKELIQTTGSEVVVVKAQIHAGGRGKGGGVKVVKGASAAQEAASKLLGMQLVTHQTGPAGKKVERLLVEQGVAIGKELYVALLVDRDSRAVTVIASTEGGVEIEEVAHHSPEKILRHTISPISGFSPFQARTLGFQLGFTAAQVGTFTKLLQSLYNLLIEQDCSQVEINPLVITQAGEIIALDGKINLDENAEFRHKEWAELRDLSEEDPAETDAKKANLSYIQLDGNIGCLVNGAGLAMATMDIIKHYGGEPANFLDVGGGATREAVTTAFKIILRSPSVRGIFVNIFGGIMKCDVIAQGVIAASKEVGLKIPAVVRLEGTNVEEGRALLASSGLAITPAATMAEGAQKIVELVRKGS